MSYWLNVSAMSAARDQGDVPAFFGIGICSMKDWRFTLQSRVVMPMRLAFGAGEYISDQSNVVVQVWWCVCVNKAGEQGARLCVYTAGHLTLEGGDLVK